jgi:hypothetical protein
MSVHSAAGIIFVDPFINTLTDPEFKTGTEAADRDLLKSLIVFACLMEGLFFYVGFVQVLSLGRQNRMTGAAQCAARSRAARGERRRARRRPRQGAD